MNCKKWLISDPLFVATTGFMALLDYSFDRFFKANLYLNPYLSSLYVFQYNLILPIINLGLLYVLFYALDHVKRKKTSTLFKVTGRGG